jgi:Zn-dependent protease
MSISFILMIAFLIFINLALIWLLMSAPVGRRTVTVSRLIPSSASHLWSALFPLANNAKWSGAYISVQPLGKNGAELELDWDGRDGKPIQRSVIFENVEENQHFSLKISDDTSLDPSFWQNYSESVTLEGMADQTRVTITETDTYRGFAFLVFRFFKNRRILANLDNWAKTGIYKPVGIFEKPPMQIGMALLSAIIMWPFFGLTKTGLILSLTLTSVVALHELGHILAFRIMGHRSARMIFIPILGGFALGGRPYDRHFEVGFSALMGAGFSVFPVVVALGLYQPLLEMQYFTAAAIIGTFGLMGAIFNLANLAPMWKFDGGQVIRQLFKGRWQQGFVSFIMLGGLLGVCKLSGFSDQTLILVGAVFALLSLLTSGQSFKPKHALHPMIVKERIMLTLGLVATFFVHACASVWGLSVIL